MRVATGAATMVAVAVAGALAVPAALVATQPRVSPPRLPAVKVMALVVAPAVRVPPAIVQA